MVLLDRRGLELAFGHRLDPLLVDAGHVHRSRLDRHVGPAGRQRDLLQETRVQLRPDLLALVHEPAPALDRHPRSGLAVADPHGVDGDRTLGRPRGRLHRKAPVVLTVGEDDDHLVVGDLVGERFDRHPNRVAEQRPAARGRLGRDLLGGKTDGAVVDRQRALQPRRAGKRHEADAVAGQLVEQVADELASTAPAGPAARRRPASTGRRPGRS